MHIGIPKYLNHISKLISISDSASIAIHSLVLIANTDKHLNATQIADALGFSRNHLAKVLQFLTRHNYLDSCRGPKGGFKLKSNPEDISILEIYELIEGRVDKKRCIHNFKKCLFKNCVYGELGAEFTNHFKNYFGNRKLSDIMTKSKSLNKKHDKRNN